MRGEEELQDSCITPGTINPLSKHEDRKCAFTGTSRRRDKETKSAGYSLQFRLRFLQITKQI